MALSSRMRQAHLFCEAHVSVDDGGTIQTKPPCNMAVRESEVKGSV